MAGQTIMEGVCERLRGEYKRRLGYASEKSGVPFHTLTKIAYSRSNPRASTLQKIIDFFEREDAIKAASEKIERDMARE